MNRIELLNLKDEIALELQRRMTFSDIDSYLTSFKIPAYKEPSVNSKRVYVKELLAEVDKEIVVEIANELGIDIDIDNSNDVLDLSFWDKDMFRLFISHLAIHKTKMTTLKSELKKYNISSFVAHEDIEPAKEWQDEIEKGLLTMDALLALLTEEFHESKWTDQEVGAAIGRQILVIPLRKGIDPYGFIGKYQGVKGYGVTFGEVTKDIWNIIRKHEKTTKIYYKNLFSKLVQSNNELEYQRLLGLLIDSEDTIPRKQLVEFAERTKFSKFILDNKTLLKGVNELLKKFEIDTISPVLEVEDVTEDDLPF